MPGQRAMKKKNRLRVSMSMDEDALGAVVGALALLKWGSPEVLSRGNILVRSPEFERGLCIVREAAVRVARVRALETAQRKVEEERVERIMATCGAVNVDACGVFADVEGGEP